MILALESSCDETAVAFFDPARGLAGEWVHSQIALHERHGGVVPDLATREHLRTFAPLLARVRATDEFSRVKKVAVTCGPGLAGCLAVGVAAAKALALALRVPLAGVNHLRAHAWSPFIALHAEDPAAFDARLAGLLPHLGLIVSGGNTLLFSIQADRRIVTLASTRDDAAGEALDKGAKLLGLGYPGGPLIEKIAAGGRADAFDFPRGIGRRDDLAFSFSGLKTSLRYLLEKMPAAEVPARMADLCASYQQAVIDALVRKTAAALEQGPSTGPGQAGSGPAYRSLGFSGGVANNQRLRAALGRLARERRVPLLAAAPQHTGDNAGMIAFAAWADAAGTDARGMELQIEPSLML
ncbi:MAG TPA: tRNA (adenosine(37)-N6)-threonylcarbamoyltransferase complex transferase subunit TsaD [Opitutaceae bacterium]|jgi:N6-L-threonylcarbamoyladenine synthase|nr:tRNA (adenosine(37)-N6)-threonylcarbamoyltransferase complex transferase subunit TsaD [Opitutaceae bacterium]